MHYLPYIAVLALLFIPLSWPIVPFRSQLAALIVRYTQDVDLDSLIFSFRSCFSQGVQVLYMYGCLSWKIRCKLVSCYAHLLSCQSFLNIWRKLHTWYSSKPQWSLSVFCCSAGPWQPNAKLFPILSIFKSSCCSFLSRSSIVPRHFYPASPFQWFSRHNWLLSSTCPPHYALLIFSFSELLSRPWTCSLQSSLRPPRLS